MPRTATLAALVVCGLALAGCDSFDPLDKFQDWDLLGSNKTPLRGERRDVFPQGVPGVPQGVPPDMVKGYQPPAEEPPAVIEAKQPKAKQKQQQKKTAAAPRKQPRQQAPQEPDEEPMQQAPAARTTTQPVQQGQGGFQTMPGAQPTWPADAQPAPRR
jgi:hypothetical protein